MVKRCERATDAVPNVTSISRQSYLGITLCQKALSEKDHEISSRAILNRFNQKVITTDALLCFQKRFVGKVAIICCLSKRINRSC